MQSPRCNRAAFRKIPDQANPQNKFLSAHLYTEVGRIKGGSSVVSALLVYKSFFVWFLHHCVSPIINLLTLKTLQAVCVAAPSLISLNYNKEVAVVCTVSSLQYKSSVWWILYLQRSFWSEIRILRVLTCSMTLRARRVHEASFYGPTVSCGSLFQSS